MENLTRRTILLAVFPLTLNSLTLPVQARGLKLRFGRGIARGLARKSYTPDVMTPSQLRACVDLDAEIRFTTIASSKDEIRIEAKRAELENFRGELEIEQTAASFKGQYEVDRFNRKVDSFNQERERFNEMIEAFNRENSERNISIQKFNQSCANKKYYEEDMAELGASSE